MRERIDPKLKDKWEKKLADAGLPEKMAPLGVPITQVAEREVLEIFDPEMQASLKKLSVLPDKVQEDVLADMRNQRERGVSPREILDRFDILVAKGEELTKLSSEDSDKDHKPKPSKEDLDRAKEEKVTEKDVDRLIKRIERIIKKENFESRGGAYKYKH